MVLNTFLWGDNIININEEVNYELAEKIKNNEDNVEYSCGWYFINFSKRLLGV